MTRIRKQHKLQATWIARWLWIKHVNSTNSRKAPLTDLIAFERRFKASPEQIASIMHHFIHERCSWY
jgi:hypothetical protein